MHKHRRNYNQISKLITPELSEKQAVWKSNNQGFKEDTFIQTDRKGTVVETGREVVQHGKVAVVGLAAAEAAEQMGRTP